MTVLRQFVVLLRNNWKEQRPGRVVPVPQPELRYERREGKVSTRTDSWIIVEDGGTVNFTPQSFAWSEEKVETPVTINGKVARRRVDGERREPKTLLLGYTNDGEETDEHGLEPGEAESHGGILGEARKILINHRKGFGGWDQVDPGQINDASNTVGKNQSRGTIEVTATKFAETLGGG